MNDVFTDPLPGVTKKCFCAKTVGDDYSDCLDKGYGTSFAVISAHEENFDTFYFWTINGDVCKLIPSWYYRFPKGCLNDNELELFKGQTVISCAEKCDQNANCANFEIYYPYGGQDNSAVPGDCKLGIDAPIEDFESCNG